MNSVEPNPEIKWTLPIAFAAILISTGLIMAATLTVSLWLPLNNTINILIAVSLADLVVVLWLAALARINYGSISKGFGLDTPLKPGWLWKIPLICLGLYAFDWLYTLVTLSFDIKIQTQDLVTMIADLQSPVEIALVLFFVAGLVPVFEEIICRACLYSALKKRIGITWAIILSAFIFALIHGNLSILLPLFVVGIALAWVFERSKSLLASIITHGLFNLINIILVLAFGTEII